MGLGQAVAFIFEDKLWVNKLAVVLLLAFLSLIPGLGFFTLAVLLGYLVAIVNNVKKRAFVLLPRWDGWEKKLTDGGKVLLAMFIYNAPTLLFSCCLWSVPQFFPRNETVSSGTLFVALFCVLPVFTMYSVVAWSLLALGVIRFAESGQARELYRFSVLFDDLQTNFNLTIQWVLLATLLNVILSLVAATVCGVIVSLMFALPVHAHLLGQYAVRLKSSSLAAPMPQTPPPSPTAPRPRK